MSEVINIKELNERIERESVFVDTLRNEMGKVIVGQSHLVDTLLIGLLSNGHILLEGVPGLAKTLAITTLAKAVDACFSRIQFTPDLLPADLIGTLIYSQKNEDFVVRRGPIFANFVLADEINRSPAKVQSALLEAMQERQVTIGDNTYPLPQPFLVLATQNPLGLAGTYPLPEAQLDRFLLCVHMGYPAPGEEVRILDLARGGTRPEDLPAVTSAQEILEMQRRCREVKTAEAVKQYVVRIAEETRRDRNVSLGASPRASLMLLTASMAWALLHGRDYVLPDDVQRLAVPVLAHRIRLKAQAGYQQKSAEDVVRAIVGSLRVPTGL